ncbi:MAG: hypothetical protein E6H06_16645 [Bacteroidetes bacterium]|nr:MAG: hypothetical protein E6H06_16645 [Bacteroidota bacterium]
MHENTTMLAGQQSPTALEDSSSFSQYLSFRFYKENLEHFTEATKDSINNFLKTISEIEEDFLTMLREQQMKNLELHDFGFNDDVAGYMEQNY